MQAHLTGTATDAEGIPVGTIVSDQRLELTGLELSGENAF